MIKESVEYSRERKCFGNALLGFQSWRYWLADIQATMEESKSLTSRAFDGFVRSLPSAKEAAMSKLFSAEAMPTISHITR